MAVLAGCAAFLSTAVVCAAIAVAALKVTWSASPLCEAAYAYLDGARPSSLHNLCVGGGLAALAHLMDLTLWRGCVAGCYATLHLAAAACLVLYGLMLRTHEVPVLPVGLGGLVICVAVHKLQLCFFGEDSACGVLYGISAGYLVVAVGLVAAWSRWLVSPEGFEQFEASLNSELSTVLAWYPCLLGAVLFVASLVTWMRASMAERIKEVEEGHVPLPPQLKVTVILLTTGAIMAWLAASIAAESDFLSKLIMQIAGLTFFGTVVYLCDWVGRRRAVLLMERNKKLQQLRGLLTSDWLKAMLVLPALPLSPLFLVADALHQAVRRCCRPCSGMSEEAIGTGCLTHESAQLLQELSSWPWTSVLTKSMYIGLAHFSVQVGVEKGLVVFLAWFNEVLEPWSLLSATLLLFLVELALFLFPPVAGIPLYMIGGIVIIPKVMSSGFSFWPAIGVGTAFCLFLKLVAVIAEQKGIGQPFSNSVAVKKFIGVQTRFMKAVRLILSQRGLSAAKVAVLCGGPDWPTSVITGIMDLPLLEMLVGTVPVVLIIFPTVLSAGFKLEAEKDASLNTMSGFSILAASILQGVSCASAAYYTQAVMDEYDAEFSREGSSFQRDPQEQEVLAALEIDERQARKWEALTCWQVQPFLARLLLVVGSLFSTATIGIVVNPSVESFRKFDITDRVSELPGGSPFSIILPPFWWAVSTLCTVIACLVLFQVWCWLLVRCCPRGPAPEDAPSLEMVARASTASAGRRSEA